MAIQRSVLLIADIGGYTRFMRTHRMALSHAQEMVAELLEAVLDASSPLKLAKLEGDAAFLYAPVDGKREPGTVGRAIANIRRAFLARQQEMAFNQTCTCQGCGDVEQLKIKFVAHVGEVAFQKVKRNTELAGVDVILVHRMLKNDVPVAEYALVTDEALGDLEEGLRRHARPLPHDFEGIGPTQTHYIDLVEIAAELPPVRRKTFLQKLWDRIVVNVKSVPYILGLKEPCPNFRNVEKIEAALPADTQVR